MTDVILELVAGARPFAVPARADWCGAMLPVGVSGVYLLLRQGQPYYVGRSDNCLRTRLIGHEHVDAQTQVVWRPVVNARQGFLLEAYWYDKLQPTGRLVNAIHPARPSGSDLSCPYCVLETPKVQAAIDHIFQRAPVGAGPFVSPSCALSDGSVPPG